MAIVDGTFGSEPSTITELSAMPAGQTGNVDTTNILYIGNRAKINSVKLRFVQSVGATPTCTYSIQVAADSGLSFGAATYADSATPTTDVSTTFVLTAGGLAAEKIVKFPTNWTYLKVTSSANTNVTFWISALLDPWKRWV